MTWTRSDEHLPFHRKWLSLSNDAFAMGMRAMIWARSPQAKARPGFVTERELRALSGGISLRRFRAALDELVTAGAPAHEQGILDPVDGGFEIHDFEHYGPPGSRDAAPPLPPDGKPKLDRSEAARLAGQASAAARKAKNGTAQPSRTSPNVVPNVPERRSVERSSNEQDQPINFVPESSDPDPEQTNTIEPKTSNESRERRSAPNVVVGIRNEDSEELTTCPSDLLERARGGGHLRLVADELDVPIWDVEAEAQGFFDYWTIGRGMGGRKRDWVGALRQRIVERHRDGKLLGVGTPPGEREHGERVAAERRTVEKVPPRRLGRPVPPSEDDLKRITEIFGPRVAAGGAE